jgi:hypothetical protein
VFFRLITVIFFVLPVSAVPPGANAALAPLMAYNGTWQVTRNNAPKPDTMVNQCVAVGTYLACHQTVNDGAASLLVFIPSKTAGQFYTQTILPDGRAGGRGDLTVEGDTWTFLNRWNQAAGKSSFYRVVNVFKGKNQIHFEQQQSDDGTNWKTTASGDEVRVSSARGKAAPR